MKTLIDGDIVSYSCAIYNEEFGWDAARSDIDNMMRRILETTGATDYECYITGSNNFRYQVDPEYKANRKGKTDPKYRADANAYLVTAFGAKVTDGIEADDALSASQVSRHGGDSIICSIDKDLKQIPGHHYNWRKNEFDFVTPVDGLRSFYRSLITGDVADHIIGIRGLGPVKSARIINNLEDEIDMFETLQALYNDDQRLLKNANLLWLTREEGKIWTYEAEEKGFPIDTSSQRLVVGNGPAR